MPDKSGFDVVEATIATMRTALDSGAVTVRQLVQAYLDRIAAYDQTGPSINAIISINPKALEDADASDAILRRSGPIGPLHGIPMIMKDQGDVAGMRTTMGSVLFEHHEPGRDAFVTDKLKKAGAIFIAKATLGELGAGDTHGSLFGSTRCVYDLERTAGGSSGGSGASVSANFCAAAIGQEGYASIRRPAAWNGIAGMRPSAGLVSRTGVYGGWPSIHGSLGPMTRTVADLALVLDSMVGYDPADPITAHGVGKIPASYAAGLDRNALKGARIGVLRETIGFRSEPDSEDFRNGTVLFDQAIADLRQAGATIVDPIVIPDLKALLAARSRDGEEDAACFEEYVAGSAASPFATRAEAMASSRYAEVFPGAKARWESAHTDVQHHKSDQARATLMTRYHKVMADHGLDAIVHKAVEHQATPIVDGVNPPYRDQMGAIHINTFLVFVPAVVVPTGFTPDNLSTGITFLGRPYDDALMLRYAYAYEQATHHRRPPASMPPL